MVPLLYYYNYNFISLTGPGVSVERPNVTVPENETEVEICLILSTGIVEQVVVTAETGPKTGAADQATGITVLFMNHTSCGYIHFFCS